MKKGIVCAIFILSCFLMQCTVFHSLSFGGIIPNLMLIVTASYGFMRGRKNGLLTGFFSGLLIDIFFGNLPGFSTLIYLYTGYINGCFSKMFYPEDIKLPLTLILVSDLAYNLVCYLLAFLLNGRFDFWYYFTHIILPEMVYTLVATCALYPLLLMVEKRLEWKEQ